MNNNEVIKKDNDSRKIFTTLILIFALMICTTSATYAFFAITATNNNTITGTAATVDLELTVTPATLGGTSSGTSTGVMVPQDVDHLGTAMGTNYKCVDDYGNIVCKTYTVTIKNASDAAVALNGTIQFLAPKSTPAGTNTYTNLYWRKTTSVTSLGTGTSVKVVNASNGAIVSNTSATDCDTTGTYCSKIYDIPSGSVCDISGSSGCTQIKLAAGASTSYYVVIWIEETGNSQNSTDKGIWNAIIHFEGENGTGVTSSITSSS